MSEQPPAPGRAPTQGGAQADAPRPSPPAASAPLFFGLVVGAMGFLLLYLRLFAGARLDAPTLGLAAALAALMYALRALFWVVQALARKDVETVIAGETAGPRRRAELRDEKHRVLKAIKELDFDHQMGKLSDEDHRLIGDRYRLRAVEIMRALDGAAELHPELARMLAQLEAGGAPEREPGSADVARACSGCETLNDPDARFCKSCGKELNP